VVWSIAINSVQLHVQKKLMEQSLSMYVSPKRVKQISRNSEILKPGAEKQEVSILFSDIANFTSMSEGMDSDELARVMNNYFEKAVGNCIQAEDGTVVKFIGDAIFAMWNAPERQTDHQAMACRGALRLTKEVSAFESAKKDLDVRTRIGLHCGVANVGNFGSKQRVDYTALGENINLASRMEGLNKYMGTDVLITGDVYRAVSDKFTTRFCGKFKLKGFERAVEVYELIADAAQAGETRAWREAYAAALALYLKKDFAGAEAAWQKVIEMRGGKDGPSKFMLKHLAEMRAEPLDPEWDGEVELKEK
jgi:adenylate cyclase